MRKIILYDSNTGNTRAMAIAIAEGSEQSGAETVIMNVSEADPQSVLSFDVLYLGCPAMGVEMVGDAQTDFCRSIGMKFNGKKVALFGSCESGSGIWLRKWGSSLKGWGAIIVNAPGTLSKLHPDEDKLEECRMLGQTNFD